MQSKQQNVNEKNISNIAGNLEDLASLHFLDLCLLGETGTGKTHTAKLIHDLRPRSGRPMVSVNCAELSLSLIESELFGHEKGAFTGAACSKEGTFEAAAGGTLFLDEIGELEAAAQVKILRALQEREIERIGSREPAPVDVRVVAATNKDLEQEVIEGRFREDLWFRLNVVRLKVPPLRQRKQDVPALIRLLAERHSRQMGRPAPIFTAEALRALSAYSWPGNVRELENLVMRLIALRPGKTIRMVDIPVEYCVEELSNMALHFAKRERESQSRSIYSMACDHFEHFFVRHMVERCGGNKAEAARRLGVSYATVKNKMDIRDIAADDPGDEEPTDPGL